FVGREADAELLDHVGTDAARLQIFARVSAAGGAQRGRVVFRSGGRDSIDPLAAIVLAAIFEIVLRQRHAGEFGKALDSFRKRQTLELHRQPEPVAFLTAAEAVEDALLVEHVERRRLLGVERAARPVITGGGASFALVPGETFAGVIGNRNPVAHLA